MKKTGKDVDTKVVARLDTRALDEIPMGVLRIDAGQQIRYMNAAAHSVLGSQVSVGTSLSQIAMDKESRARLRTQLRERIES